MTHPERDTAPWAGPVTVEISGITDPATFNRLPDALTALWESMRALPLGELQHDWFGCYLTRPDAVQRVAENLGRNGDVTLSFALPDGTYLMRVFTE
ncbi:hypothetical protein P3T37_000537 [Kitasatospora sp. MAA4]|uniref:hypothetical protein n=1 Tax=Kitasatospora sp. MAA4 TaxID=3035093 RepID=UPI0024762F80|nr:hypothetical protein [Kitasatospora sp. MAA4]MDH6131168.1 hypothetical protein [Kitasatospora sp. MAA4]